MKFVWIKKLSYMNICLHRKSLSLAEWQIDVELHSGEGICHEFPQNEKPTRLSVWTISESYKAHCILSERVPESSIPLVFWSSSETLFVGCVRIQLEIWFIHNQRNLGVFSQQISFKPYCIQGLLDHWLFCSHRDHVPFVHSLNKFIKL